MPDQTSSPSPPASIGRQCACYNLRRARRMLTRSYDACLAPSGLRATQFSFLAAAASLSPTTLSHLAAIMDNERTTLTRNLKLLEDKGLLRSEAGQDRREHIVSITGAERAALLAALPHWEQAQAAEQERLGGDRLPRILEDLAALKEAAAAKPLRRNRN